MNSNVIEVRISDLLAMLLKRIKLIVCIAVLLGLVGAAYGAYSVVRAQPQVTQADVDAAERRVAAAESSMSIAEKSLSFRDTTKFPTAEKKVQRAERLVTQLQEYMENSIYFNMDPFHRGAARLRFSVEADIAVTPDTAVPYEDPRVGIVIVYSQMCPFDSEVMGQLRLILGTEAPSQYVEELVSVTSDDDHHVVEICILYDDLQKADQAINYLYQTMTARAKNSFPDHQTNVLTAFVGYETDPDMNISHIDLETNLINAEKALLAANESFQKLQNDTTEEQAVTDASAELAQAKTALQNAQANHAKNRPSLHSMARRGIKYGLLGGFIGIFLACCLVWAQGLFGGIIQNQNEVISRYAFPLIGVLPRTKRLWFDTAIRKLEGEPTGNFEDTAQATAQSLLSRIGEKTVCLVSTGNSAIAQRLSSYTNDTIPVIGNIIDNGEAVKELENYEGIVLVEERGKSRVDLVDAEVLRAKALNKDILGIVLA